MDKEQIKNEILKITDWRHPFEIEPGVWVKLHRDWFKDWHQWRVRVSMPHIETIARCILPEGLTNATVLDIGCWDGFYGFEFLKRGAKFLKGIDLRDEAIRRANLLKDYFGYTDCQFEKINIQDKQFKNNTYDITLLYGILYHLSSPIDVVKTVGEITNSLVLVNTYAFDDPEPVLKLKRENPEKDSTGFQELVTTPSREALIEMLDFAGFDIILRDYPYPFYERYRDSDFGFFYGIKSGDTGEDKIRELFRELNVKETYEPKLKQPQVVHLKSPGNRDVRQTFKKRIGLKLHNIIDKLF